MVNYYICWHSAVVFIWLEQTGLAEATQTHRETRPRAESCLQTRALASALHRQHWQRHPDARLEARSCCLGRQHARFWDAAGEPRVLSRLTCEAELKLQPDALQRAAEELLCPGRGLRWRASPVRRFLRRYRLRSALFLVVFCAGLGKGRRPAASLSALACTAANSQRLFPVRRDSGETSDKIKVQRSNSIPEWLLIGIIDLLQLTCIYYLYFWIL